MEQQTIIAAIETLSYPAAAAAWDASGLQVASHKRDIQRFAVCLDPTPESIARALEQDADMVLSHHPLLLKGRLPNTLDAYHDVLRRLFLADVALYAAHTSLDVNVYGPAGWLAEELQLQDTTILEASGKDCPHGPLGYGLVGTTPNPLSLEELTSILSSYCSLATATISGPIPKRIQRIAYCTGSGASLWPEAAAQHADIYITGDVKYHMALDTTICLLDVGHHSLEEEMMRRTALALAQMLKEVTVFFVPSSSPLRALNDTDAPYIEE